MISIDEYLARSAKRAPSEDRLNSLRAIAQETVRMEALTGSPEWDHFNSYLEARIKVGEARILEERAKLAHPMLVDPQQMMLVKMTLAGLEASTQTLREVMMLPKWLKEQGAKAWMALDELDKKTA